MVRACLVKHYIKMIERNKTSDIDPKVYCNIPWAVAHLALEEAHDTCLSLDTKMKILVNITQHNVGLLTFLIRKMNSFTL